MSYVCPIEREGLDVPKVRQQDENRSEDESSAENGLYGEWGRIFDGKKEWNKSSEREEPTRAWKVIGSGKKYRAEQYQERRLLKQIPKEFHRLL